MPLEQPVVEQQIQSEAPMSSENIGIEMQQPCLPWVPRPTSVVVNPLDANAVDAHVANHAVRDESKGAWLEDDENEMMTI
ncbi:hypothetical protein DSL72_008867 [Monilinia vaccinii-corymbosi]|uniref:Uncharacterized protein n=1 Tax=Monilinia vaccinii-corymbosi TaxID=61207 RepID=A0A8A3PQK7_9HELO|nr:hypothetical protein DSL72_008867 [Monilinia vaccinii-corymbosi]